MKFLKAPSYINTLSFQIFASFWVIFLILLSIVFFIPKLDTRNYSELTGEELLNYQQQIVTAIRENQLTRLLISKNHPLPLEQVKEIHPFLLNLETKQLIGVLEDEMELARQFILTATDPAKPLVRTLDNTKIAGPFTIHLSSIEDENKEEPYALFFAQKVDPQRDLVNQVFDRPGLLLIFIMILSFPLLLWQTLRISGPLKKLNLAAKSVSLGNFTVTPDLETHGVSEFRRVGKTFNQMIEAIDGLLKTHQMLLSSVSHELRTPLTRLQLATALLRRRVGESSEITRIETEITRLNLMIDDLLKFSRNQVNIHSKRDIFPLEELWQDVILDAAFEAEQHHLQFHFIQNIKNPERYDLLGNKQSLTSALENLLRNALKYTHSTISAQIQLLGNNVCIHVDDDGAGLKEKEYQKIFKPFYRVDEERTKTKAGTGLGLAIVENSVLQHYGKIWAEKSPLGGLRVTVILPLYTGGVAVIK